MQFLREDNGFNYWNPGYVAKNMSRNDALPYSGVDYLRFSYFFFLTILWNIKQRNKFRERDLIIISQSISRGVWFQGVSKKIVSLNVKNLYRYSKSEKNDENYETESLSATASDETNELLLLKSS